MAAFFFLCGLIGWWCSAPKITAKSPSSLADPLPACILSPACMPGWDFLPLFHGGSTEAAGKQSSRRSSEVFNAELLGKRGLPCASLLWEAMGPETVGGKDAVLKLRLNILKRDARAQGRAELWLG